VIIGIVIALVAGKTIGISAATWLAVRTGLGAMPAGATWRHVGGVASVAGIGFTVSLFVAGLAFGPGTPLEDSAKVGVLLGSTTAALIGSIALIVGTAAARHR
jgi:NhaA family Na+:H+ antiporter